MMGRGRRFSFAPALGGPKAAGRERMVAPDAAATGGRPPGTESAAAAAAAAAPDLEAGIAAIFANLREVGADPARRAADAAGVTPVDDGVTFDLLGELDRIWRNRAA